MTFCPLIKGECREDCAFYTKDIEYTLCLISALVLHKIGGD